MSKYIVNVKEVWIQPVEVEADSPGEAIAKTQSPGGRILEDHFEFSHCLDSNLWTSEEVEEVKTNVG